MRKLVLDDLLPEPASVTLDGVDYPVVAQSVEAFLQFMKRQEQLQSMAQQTEATPALIEQNIDLICIAVPTLPRERLMGLPLPALMRLVEFIGEEMLGRPASGEDEAKEQSGEVGETAES